MKPWLWMFAMMMGVALAAGCAANGAPEPAVESEQEREVETKERERVASLPTTDEDREEKSISPSSPSMDETNESKNETVPTASQPVSTVTVEQLRAKYRAELTELQNHYVAKLAGMYAEAEQEAKAGKSKNALYEEYAKRGGALSEESQAKVNQVLARMQDDLRANDLPLSGVDPLRNEYKQAINQARSDVMAKIRAAFGI